LKARLAPLAAMLLGRAQHPQEEKASAVQDCSVEHKMNYIDAHCKLPATSLATSIQENRPSPEFLREPANCKNGDGLR